MKDLLTGQLTEILKVLSNGLKTGVSFASIQLPIFLQELVKFGIAKSAAGILLGITFIVIGIIICRWTQKKYSNPEGVDIMVLLFACGGGIWIVGYNLYNLLMATFAPRLYLFYEIRELIR